MHNSGHYYAVNTRWNKSLFQHASSLLHIDFWSTNCLIKGLKDFPLSTLLIWSHGFSNLGQFTTCNTLKHPPLCFSFSQKLSKIIPDKNLLFMEHLYLTHYKRKMQKHMFSKLINTEMYCPSNLSKALMGKMKVLKFTLIPWIKIYDGPYGPWERNSTLQ